MARTDKGFMGNLLVKFQRNFGNAGTVRFDVPPPLLKPRPNRRGFFGSARSLS